MNPRDDRTPPAATPEATAAPSATDRFAPRASREMAGMFDDVSARYDLINRLMTLGLDAGWRSDMADAVPDDASVVLDLCTGNGVSAEELREAGRTVLGLDVSFRMLRDARSSYGVGAWAPRFACADAFRMPVASASVAAVTVAFGMRNLRPRAEALREIARVLEPGGTLAVLEATAPSDGPLAPLHRAWVRHVIPLLGRLSPDPSAYRYLSESIFEFGDGAAFQRDLEAAGFVPCGRRRFMLGAAALFAARRPGVGEDAQGGRGEGVAAGDSTRRGDGDVQIAGRVHAGWGELPHRDRRRLAEWRLWNGLKMVIALAIVGTLLWGFGDFTAYADRAPLAHWQRTGMRVLLVSGVAIFSLRALLLLGRVLGRPPRR